jgi:starch synthase (maltosyl-transferring)
MARRPARKATDPPAATARRRPAEGGPAPRRTRAGTARRATDPAPRPIDAARPVTRGEDSNVIVPGTPAAARPATRAAQAPTSGPATAKEPTARPGDAVEREAVASALDPRRVIVQNLQPRVDDGRFPVKRTAGETLEIYAEVFGDGHDALAVVLRHRRVGANTWNETRMTHHGNDEWHALLPLEREGAYEYTVHAWVDRFVTWRDALRKKAEAGQDVASELLEGSALVRDAAMRAPAPRAKMLETLAARLAGDEAQSDRVTLALEDMLREIMHSLSKRSGLVTAGATLTVRVEREHARFGAWYEMFPRSAPSARARGANLADAARRLPHVAELGFDIVYLPPVHPIGRTHRKGPNNTLVAAAGDPGSPWAIGAAEGGHKAVHPDLGTLDDFDAFVAAGRRLGLEVALDLAYQCSPDHPYVREHPEWFRHRPDGTIKYAENPPKKYQDIYPFDFECDDWQGLWNELKSIVTFWIGHGVKVFRVDNPHTKPFRFWAWLIGEVQREHPDTIFLSEAFTRPKVMQHLAKIGFTQSYSYFTWRNTKHEITEYLTELTQTPVREFMRPNLFVNTPDILHEYLQVGGRPAFMTRFVLAATLGASYGIYGPGFELCEGRAVPGTEEYQDSEKYQVQHWDDDRPGHIRDLIGRVNAARREQRALQHDHRLRFHEVDNEQLIAYSKSVADLSNIVVTVVNLDPHHVQEGMVRLPLHELGISPHEPYQVHDLLSDARYLWQGEHNYVRLDPFACPAHLFVVRRRVKTEKDFDYYL